MNKITSLKEVIGTQPGWRRDPGYIVYERGCFEFSLNLWHYSTWALGISVTVDIFSYDLEFLVGPATIMFTWERDNE